MCFENSGKGEISRTQISVLGMAVSMLVVSILMSVTSAIFFTDLFM